VAILVACSFIPLALIARTRATHSPHTRLQIIPDMDQQPSFKTQSANPLFADGRAMRPPPDGTVALGQADLDPHFFRGLVPARSGAVGPGTPPARPEAPTGTTAVTAAGASAMTPALAWAETFPFPVTREVVRRGRERYDIFCAPCHGLVGGGDGIVNLRADRLQEGTWTPPANLYGDLVLQRPVGHVYNTITNGIRNMPAYGPQIPERDRWAIVAYARALQRSQHAPLEDVPEEQRGSLR
jgi:mono/diheme cytochrome c family protein